MIFPIKFSSDTASCIMFVATDKRHSFCSAVRITRRWYTTHFDRSSQRTESRAGTIPCPRERGSSRTPPCKQGCPKVYPQPSKKISFGTFWSDLVCNQATKNCARICFGGTVEKLIPGRCPNWKPSFRNTRFLPLSTSRTLKIKQCFRKWIC